MKTSCSLSPITYKIINQKNILAKKIIENTDKINSLKYSDNIPKHITQFSELEKNDEIKKSNITKINNNTEKY